MKEKCFYCDHEFEEGKHYTVSFLRDGDEQMEPLCAVCYTEWLEGIKE
ncbi:MULTISPECIES: hypothetical protein [Fictibacillus]|uniref:SR1 protein n=1 Tax=Fictibacillus terranigra TaxID=3058424 RepID=A0ABT8E8Y2_9BACL|nr:hypothetical protein [Fictibacillus sp. CENA-BCM004]MDN4074372.1 hypothetical protein [Fictibacillus sp. CENA-BCM004]